MYLGVAVHAASAQQEYRGHILGESQRGLRDAWVVIGSVALLAQQRWTLHQQRRIIRAVGAMTKRAVLRYRGMFPQERSAFIGVAAVTGLVNGIADEQRRRERAVWPVAIRAAHLAETHRVGMRGIEFHACLRVALLAYRRLFASEGDGIANGMDGMTIYAGESFALMHAARPSVASPARMAAETHRILLRDTRR